MENPKLWPTIEQKVFEASVKVVRRSVGPDQRYRPTVKLSNVEIALPSCYSLEDAIRDGVNYLKQEIERKPAPIG